MSARRHRGPGPEDRILFGPELVPVLRAAVREYSWLLTRGYPEDAALKLVGDRHKLRARQRAAVKRSACADQILEARRARRVCADAVRGRELWIDGFNLVIALETALGGGVLLRGRDGCLRDLNQLRGSYRLVAETEPALAAAARFLAGLDLAHVVWLLDRPVSNSGRLAACVARALDAAAVPCEVRIERDPDEVLLGARGPVASGDARVLDGSAAWYDLASAIAAQLSVTPWILDLGEGGRRAD